MEKRWRIMAWIGEIFVLSVEGLKIKKITTVKNKRPVF
jgi:hypothetical protein